jgi:hypothetical protein
MPTYQIIASLTAIDRDNYWFINKDGKIRLFPRKF